MQNSHIIIPARLDSQRLARKMLADIGGLPLIIRTAQNALKTNMEVVVATDSDEIASVCQSYDIATIITGMHNSGTERIVEVVKRLNYSPDDIVINLQGDEPFMNTNLVLELLQFIRDKRANMATVATNKINVDDANNPNIVKVTLDKHNNALYFSRAGIPFDRNNRAFSDLMLRHIGLYAYTVEFLNMYPKTVSPLESIECLEQLRVIYNGYKIAVMTTDNDVPGGIDTMDDLIRANNYIGPY